MEDPIQAMMELVIPPSGKSRSLVNMRSVAFNIPEAVKMLIKNNVHVDLASLLKGKSREPSSLCKTVT